MLTSLSFNIIYKHFEIVFCFTFKLTHLFDNIQIESQYIYNKPMPHLAFILLLSCPHPKQTSAEKTGTIDHSTMTCAPFN